MMDQERVKIFKKSTPGRVRLSNYVNYVSTPGRVSGEFEIDIAWRFRRAVSRCMKVLDHE